MEKTIKKLTDLRGISGFEYMIADEIIKMFSPYCDEIKKDNLGNIIALKKGKKSNFKIMLEAHCDEIGLMVSKILKDGMLSFVAIGGIDERILPSSEVIIHGKKDIKGVIGAKPPHLLSAEEMKKSTKIKDMTIDTGLSYEEVKENIIVGSPVTFFQSSGELMNKNYSAKSLDDRMGIGIILEIFKNNYDIDADIYASISVSEEVGLRGARVSAFNIEPDMAIAIDVCHGITPDNSRDAFSLGEGVVISVGPNVNKNLSDELLKIAKENDIKTNIEVCPDSTGTDAWAIQVTKTGVATMVLSIPLKYMHTSVETMNFDDFKACIKLIDKFLKNSDKITREWLCC